MRPSIAWDPRLWSLLLVCLVFTIDINLPLGVAAGVPYVFAVLVAISAKPAWYAPFVAAICCTLTVVKLGIVTERGSTEYWKVLVNRGLALFAIVMIAILGHLRRKAEAARLQAENREKSRQMELSHIGRLSLLGQASASLAHELNQPLTAIRLQSDVANRIMEASGDADPRFRTALREISTQATRAAEIIRTVRRLAQRTPLCSEPIDIQDLCQGVRRLMDWQLQRNGIDLTIHIPENLAAEVLGDRVQLEQVLVNLIQNSIEAVENLPLEQRQIRLEVSPAQELIQLAVIDRGPGVAYPERLFEAFYTTKSQGLGLGLAISRSIVESHGGSMGVESAPGQGTRIWLKLPATHSVSTEK